MAHVSSFQLLCSFHFLFASHMFWIHLFHNIVTELPIASMLASALSMALTWTSLQETWGMPIWPLHTASFPSSNTWYAYGGTKLKCHTFSSYFWKCLAHLMSNSNISSTSHFIVQGKNDSHLPSAICIPQKYVLIYCMEIHTQKKLT